MYPAYVVDCAPASPYTYSSSTHRFPDERTPIEATPLSSVELGLRLGLGLGFHSLSHFSSHTLSFFWEPDVHVRPTLSSIWRRKRGKGEGGGCKFATWRPPQTINLRSDAGGEGTVFGDERIVTRMQADHVGKDRFFTGWAFCKERCAATKIHPSPSAEVYPTPTALY